MSVHEPPQFTPGQILDAGYRAETEGRTDFAQQLYRHLVDHYPGTSEAGAAHQGLARMLPPQPATANGGPHVGTAANATTLGSLWPPAGSVAASRQPEQAHFDQPYTPQLPADPFAVPRGGEPAFTQWTQQPGSQSPMQPPSQSGPQPAPGASTALMPRIAQRHVMLPPPVRDYRTGRLVARLTTWLGVVQVVVGLALLPIALLSPRSLFSLPLIGAVIGNPAVGLGTLVAGLLQIVLGQVIRAVLDHANAARELVAIARAQAEAPPDQTTRPPRR